MVECTISPLSAMQLDVPSRPPTSSPPPPLAPTKGMSMERSANPPASDSPPLSEIVWDVSLSSTAVTPPTLAQVARRVYVGGRCDGIGMSCACEQASVRDGGVKCVLGCLYGMCEYMYVMLCRVWIRW